MLVLETEASKPPISDLKVYGVIEMAFLYDARYLIVLLRPKIKVELPTQSAENRICMGK